MALIPSANVSYYANKIFILNDDSLDRVDAIIRGFASKVSYEVDCSDGVKRKFSISDLKSFDNAKSRQIKEFSISAFDSGRFATIKLSGDDEIWVHLDGPEVDVVALRTAFEDRLSAMEPWYAALYASFFKWLYWLSAIINFGIILPTLTMKDKPAWFTVFQLFIGVLVIVLPTLWLIRKRIFPRGVFALCDGLIRYKNTETIRIAVVVGFAISVAASLVVLPLSFLV